MIIINVQKVNAIDLGISHYSKEIGRRLYFWTINSLYLPQTLKIVENKVGRGKWGVYL